MNPMKDRRTILRHKTFIQGRIYYNNRLSTIDCIVRDIGENGGRLEVPETVGLPDVFELYLPTKDEYFHATVEWRKGNSVGISWTSAPPSGPGAVQDETQNSFADRLAKLEREVASLKKRLDLQQQL